MAVLSKITPGPRGRRRTGAGPRRHRLLRREQERARSRFSGCAPYSEYQGHDGKTVSIYASIRDNEADLLQESWKQFEDCTGIEIDYEGSRRVRGAAPGAGRRR